MSVLVVGSIALDTIETPFGSVEDALGGSAVFFSASAANFHPVQVVGVVGEDYPTDSLDVLRDRGVDLSGVTEADGESFRWSGVYSFDLNSRETRETRLGVFADFKPRIPQEFRSPRIVFLGNIDPELQLNVLDQVESTDLVACDTMNLWIDQSREALLRVLERTDILMVNDSEVRQLAEEPNLLKAAQWVQDRGPQTVVVKKGEHGAMLVDRDSVFFLPGYPLEEVFDPTGAGDAFAGGFLGYLASAEEWTPSELRTAVVFGSAMGSFAVEDFSVHRLASARMEEIMDRVREFRKITSFEVRIPEPERV